MKTPINNISSVLGKIQAKVNQRHDIAVTRSLNAILERERSEVAKSISLRFGVLFSSARRNIDLIRATRNSKGIKLKIHSRRTNMSQARKIKRGVSVRNSAGGRSRINYSISDGSKPFIINAKAGGISDGENISVAGSNKKVVVYVSKDFLSRKGRNRRVTTMRWHTLAYMAIQVNKSDNLKMRVRNEFRSEYIKQLKKSKYF